MTDVNLSIQTGGSEPPHYLGPPTVGTARNRPPRQPVQTSSGALPGRAPVFALPAAAAPQAVAATQVRGRTAYALPRVPLIRSDSAVRDRSKSPPPMLPHAGRSGGSTE